MTPDISAIAEKFAKEYTGRDMTGSLLKQQIRLAIEEATASLRAQLEQRWIPVAEDTPDKAIDVLVRFTGDGKREVSDSSQAVAWLDGDGCWYDGRADRTLIVTHWMPLPASPQVAQESPLNGKAALQDKVINRWDSGKFTDSGREGK